MHLIVTALGITMIILAAMMMVRPGQFSDRMKRHARTTSLYFFELAVRFILGVALILLAGDSRVPILLRIIGGISIAAGTVFAILPRERFEQLITWLLDRFGDHIRMGSVVPFVFGGFLIYIGVTA